MTDAKTAQHTPGPWRAHLIAGRWSIWANNGGYLKVCALSVLNEGNETDARLIAAAPRMVKGLQDARMVIGALRQYVPNDLLPNVNGFLVHLGRLELDATGDCSHEGSGRTDEQARTAITKVTGELR